MAEAGTGTATAGNPATFEEAKAFVVRVEQLCMPWNVDGMAAGFAEDCVARFGLLPEMRGREAIRDFFAERSQRQVGYTLKKQLRAMMGNVLAIDWTATWKDAETGAEMKGHGVEIWQLESGKLSRWEAAFNVAEAASDCGLAII